MPQKSPQSCGPWSAEVSRRSILAGLTASTLFRPMNAASAAPAVSIGLNPLFLDSDVQLLSLLQSYLTERLERSVQLIKRRTYQEITAMLLSGQLDAAWVCDGPYVQHEDQLALLAVPLYRHAPRYQAYVIVNEESKAQSFDDVRGTVHAFSDPDSMSGFLVTRYLLVLRHATPAQFFRTSFFTYGHRNVARAVSAGLAESGSIDGYVWDILREREPDLIRKTRVVYKSEPLGSPPIVGPKSASDMTVAKAISAAFLGMAMYPRGREILAIMEFDGFTTADAELYHGTLEKWLLVKAQT